MPDKHIFILTGPRVRIAIRPTTFMLATILFDAITVRVRARPLIRPLSAFDLVNSDLMTARAERVAVNVDAPSKHEAMLRCVIAYTSGLVDSLLRSEK